MSEQKTNSKVLFYLKLAGVLVGVVVLIYIGIKSSTIINAIMRFFGFREKKENQVIIDRLTKVETNQGKTEATKDFIQSIKENYLK